MPMLSLDLALAVDKDKPEPGDHFLISVHFGAGGEDYAFVTYYKYLARLAS